MTNASRSFPRRSHAAEQWDRVLRTLMLCLAVAVATACGNYGGDSGGGSTSSTSGAPPGTPPGGTPPGGGTAGVDAFAQTVYPIVSANCSQCHAGAGPGTPHIAHPDLDTAYRAVVDNQKVNLSTPDTSRLVRRLVADFHYCWSNCISDGSEMMAAITAWAAMVQSTGGGTPVTGITSPSLTLADGVEPQGQARYQNNLIAFYDFKEGTGPVAHDTSGVAPAMDLAVDSTEWMSSYGLDFQGGMAIATRDTSRKLYEHIADPNTGSQQYTVEGWVIPANVTQEGPARMLSYSNGAGSRNFTLGQVLYNYDFRNRSLAADIGGNGTPSLQTYDADQDLQATLQHSVITFDQYRGRRIYVNGVFTDDVDEQGPGRLWNWSENHRFVLGNETGGKLPWLGKIQLIAIYDVALTQAQIDQNFDAGVGKRLVMTFDLSQWAGAGSALEFVVSELDDYSYLFCEPTLITSKPNGFRVAGLRITVNGTASVSGQAFVNVDALVTDSRQKLSSQCSVIPKELGPDDDLFAVDFEVLGNFQNPSVPLPPPPPPPPPATVPSLPGEGVRDFDRINNSMAALTGVDPNTASVQATFAELEQQLPGSFDLRTFSSSHQMAIAKLGLEYCDALVESTGLRDAFFGVIPGFDFNAPATTAFADPTARDLLIDRLVEGMFGASVASQPSPDEVRPELDQLIDTLVLNCGTNCGPERTETVVKAACAALLSSAATSVH